MAIVLTSTQMDYNPKEPIQELVKATSRFGVTSALALCEGADFTRDLFILTREKLKEPIIDARISARRKEIQGLIELHALELEYAEAVAKLQGDTNA